MPAGGGLSPQDQPVQEAEEQQTGSGREHPAGPRQDRAEYAGPQQRFVGEEDAPDSHQQRRVQPVVPRDAGCPGQVQAGQQERGEQQQAEDAPVVPGMRADGVAAPAGASGVGRAGGGPTSGMDRSWRMASKGTSTRPAGDVKR